MDLDPCGVCCERKAFRVTAATIRVMKNLLTRMLAGNECRPGVVGAVFGWLGGGLTRLYGFPQNVTLGKCSFPERTRMSRQRRRKETSGCVPNFV